MQLAALRSLIRCVFFRCPSLDDLESWAVSSKTVAWAVIAGLPTLGFLASLYARLPLFAGLMAGCFLLATTLVCRRALVQFAGRTLRLLVTARLVIVLVLGGLLFSTTGATWTALASTLLLWLVAQSLLSRTVLTDLAGQSEPKELFLESQDEPSVPSVRPRRKGSRPNVATPFST